MLKKALLVFKGGRSLLPAFGGSELTHNGTLSVGIINRLSNCGCDSPTFKTPNNPDHEDELHFAVTYFCCTSSPFYISSFGTSPANYIMSYAQQWCCTSLYLGCAFHSGILKFYSPRNAWLTLLKT